MSKDFEDIFLGQLPDSYTEMDQKTFREQLENAGDRKAFALAMVTKKYGAEQAKRFQLERHDW